MTEGKFTKQTKRTEDKEDIDDDGDRDGHGADDEDGRRSCTCSSGGSSGSSSGGSSSSSSSSSSSVVVVVAVVVVVVVPITASSSTQYPGLRFGFESPGLVLTPRASSPEPGSGFRRIAESVKGVAHDILTIGHLRASQQLAEGRAAQDCLAIADLPTLTQEVRFGHGCPVKQTRFEWTLSRLEHGCSGKRMRGRYCSSGTDAPGSG